MCEVMSAIDVHLSSTDCGDSTLQDVMAHNEVSLLLSLHTYDVIVQVTVHAGGCICSDLLY